MSHLSCLELSHSPEVGPAIVVQLGLSSRGQLQVTHLTQRVGSTLTWGKTPRMDGQKVGGNNKEELPWQKVMQPTDAEHHLSPTRGRRLLDGEIDGCGCGRAHQLLTHPPKTKDLATLQELRGAERGLHP